MDETEKILFVIRHLNHMINLLPEDDFGYDYDREAYNLAIRILRSTVDESNERLDKEVK